MWNRAELIILREVSHILSTDSMQCNVYILSLYICVTQTMGYLKRGITTRAKTSDAAVLYAVTLLTSHYDDVIMGAMASQITSLTIVYSTVYSGAYQSKHQISASLAFVWGLHRGPVNSPHKWPVTRKMFPFDDVIMNKINWKIGC